MSIERMEHVAILLPAGEKDSFLKWLYRRREVHIEPFRGTPEGWAEKFRPVEESPAAAEGAHSKLSFVAGFLNAYRTGKGGFLDSIFPIKTPANSAEVEAAAKELDVEGLWEKCQALTLAMEDAREERASLLVRRDRLREIAFLQVTPASLAGLKRVTVRFATVRADVKDAFLADERVRDSLVVECVASAGKGSVCAIASQPADADVARAVIADYGLKEILLPEADGTVHEEVAHIEELAAGEAAIEARSIESAAALAKEYWRPVTLALAWWEAERNRIRRQDLMAGSRNIFAVRGFIRIKHAGEFRSRLAEAFPSASLVVTPLAPGEDPPVSLRWNWFFRPAGLLVRMFGLPTYTAIDPTPFLTMTFLVFFGICFGDVLYGLMLISLAEYLRRRYRGQKGLMDFFRLFTYAGVSTFIFGALMGSMGADLPSYFGKDNPVERLRQGMTLLDPLAKPIVALAIAIGIGAVNQIYGIVLMFIRDARRGARDAAIYDGLLWAAYLVSLIVTALAFMGEGPKWLLYAALGAFVLSAAGLVLTQGRNEKGWTARLFVGGISLYGILGTYGTTAFIGDVVSYSRLLALALTTTVVGMAFNIIAGLLSGVPWVGWGLFALVIVGGHLFNFSISILGAFVHSARLILLEWFSRFYEGGGKAFEPFGLGSSLVELEESEH